MKMPKRAYVLKIYIETDTWEEALHELKVLGELIPSLPEEDLVENDCDRIDENTILVIMHDKAMTPERFRELKEQYWKEIKAAVEMKAYP